MKAKKKLDPKAIQQFMIDHTEKFVVGLVAALFLYFAYESFVLAHFNSYNKVPDALKAATASAKEKIDHGGPTNAEHIANETKYLPYANIIDGARQPVDPAAFPMPIPMVIKPTAPLKLREAPAVFAVEELRAIPGRGAMVKNNAGNGAATVGKRWILVKGLVPYKKQLEEFRSKFASAALETPSDVPNYAGFLVQRAEVIPGAASEPTTWKTERFVSASAEAFAKMGSRTAPEIADPRSVGRRLTSPLPDVTNVVWGGDAVYPPKIPVAPPPPAGGVMGGADPSGQQFTPGTIPVGPARGGRFAGPGRGGQPVNPGIMPPPGGPRGIDAGDDPDDETPKPSMDKVAPRDGQENDVPEYVLLRYFDFDVKPNKQYQYRVFLMLMNPNFGLKENVLNPPELAADKYIGLSGTQPAKNAEGGIDWPLNSKYVQYSPRCTSSPMTDETRLLAGNVKGDRGKEKEAAVRVLQWRPDTGLVGNFLKEGLIRGTVLNFPQAQVKIPGGPKETTNLPLNSILVDIQGGDLTPPPKDKELRTPGVILVMDKEGNLSMRDELAESKEWDEATKEPEKQLGDPTGPGRGPLRIRGQKPPETPGAIDANDLGGDTKTPKKPAGTK